ncbi:MAG: hypothetical protein HYZ93_00550 [Candidatus Omnitrophica bacterium]|nr:hypothetical protein [Candidatus Omnitrophota bacterium]
MGGLAGILASPDALLGQEGPGGTAGAEKAQEIQVAQAPVPAEPAVEQPTISLDFRDADIQTVLQALARKARLNIVTGKDVAGQVTIHLEDVSWEKALDTIVKTYGFGYEKDENVILVATLEDLKVRREAVKALTEIEPVTAKVIQLKFLDAGDVKKFLEPQLSPQGRISVLEITGQKGWGFGGAQAGGGSGEEDRQRQAREKARSKAIVITDTPTTIERLERILERIDVMPKQILIEARVMEVNRDLLRDLGLDVGTGSAGVESATALPTTLALGKQNSESPFPIIISDIGAQVLGTAVAPSIFNPKSTIGSAGTAINTGLELLFRKLNEPQFEVIVRALEEDVRTNTLSAPHILTLSGQEARILVGTKYPILQTQVSGTSSTTTTTSLAYYQDIGIELYVVPQVSGEDHVDMIVHPVVSARNGTVGTNAYPILDVRETETQVVLEKGVTVVIGGLLKDVKSKSRIGMPFLGHLPFLGPIFSRSTTDIEKIDLLIFLTAKIVEPGALSPEETERFQKQYEEFLSKKVSASAAKRPDRTAPVKE